MRQTTHNRAIITVIGPDQVGIVSEISQKLAKSDINIIEINQSLMEGTFCMYMLVDLERSKLNIPELKNQMDKIGQKISQVIHVYDEQLIQSMHRI